MEQGRRLVPFQIAILVASLLPLAVAIVATNLIWRHSAYEKDLSRNEGSDFAVVGEVSPHGSADGTLQPGHRIVFIDGDTRVAILGMYWKRRELTSGGSYSIEFERNGQRRTVSLTVSLVEGESRWVAFCRVSRPRLRLVRCSSPHA